MEVFKSIFIYFIEGFKHFSVSDLGVPLFYLILIVSCVLIFLKVFER